MSPPWEATLCVHRCGIMCDCARMIDRSVAVDANQSPAALWSEKISCGLV